MKLILGATGGTGMELVRQSIDHRPSCNGICSLAGTTEALSGPHHYKQGDLLNRVELQQVMKGHDAVRSGFGPRLPVSKADTHLLQQFAVALTTAMPNAGVRRVVVESVAFLFKDSMIPPPYLLGRLLFHGIVADPSAMERMLRESNLDWTTVRPPELTDKPYTGKYQVREDHLLVSVSKSRDRIWPISCSRQSKHMFLHARSSG